MSLRPLLQGGLLACMVFSLASASAGARAQAPDAAPAEGTLDAGAAGDDASIPTAELRLLPTDPCERLTLSFSVSELDRQEARAGCLASARLTNRQDRIDEGVLLLGFGVMSAIAGGVVTGLSVGRGDDLFTSFGLGTAGWGVINAAFSLALLDLGGEQLDAIEGARGLTGDALIRAREEAAAAQDSTATLIAVNAGLDVFYVAAGLLMFVIGDQAAPEDRWLMGYGAAMAAQGGVLLAFDAVTWAFAAERASRLRALLAE